MKRIESNTEQPKKPRQSPGRRMTYIFTVVLLVIIVVAFVGAPVIGGIAGSASQAFGTYAGNQIMLEPGNYMVRQFEGIAEQVQGSGQQITNVVANQVYREAFNRTVRHRALLEHAREAGVTFSERAQDRAMAQQPEFQIAGRFDSDEYEGMSTQQRFQLQQYTRDLLIDQQVRNDLRLPFELRDIATGEQFTYLSTVLGDELFKLPEVSEAEEAFLLQMAGPERQFRFVQFPFSDYPDEQVVEYGEANANRFRRANLSVITINSNQGDAAQLRQQIVEGQATFEDVARSQSADIYGSDGGDMGFVYYYQLEPDFEDLTTVDSIFLLDQEEVSEVLETTFGWAIYRMNESPIPPDFQDSDVLNETRRYMTGFERGIIEDYLTEEAVRFAERALEDGFDEAAASLGQSPAVTGYFPVNYGNLPYFGRVTAASNDILAAAATRQEFFIELFRLESGEVSEPIVIRDYVFVVELSDTREPTEETLSGISGSSPRLIQALSQEDLQEAIVDEELLVNNFSATYNRRFANR